MRRLVLVRHGESIWNTERRIQGHACAGLAERGFSQARAAAEALAVVDRDARVVTSDLLRAEQTAAVIAQVLGVDLERDPAVRERSFGRWEGRTKDEIAADDPDVWRRWSRGDDVVGEVGGESSAVFARRVEEALASLWDRTEDGATTIVVTHGGTIWHGTHRVLRASPGTFGGVDNASLTALVRSGRGRVQCAHWNEVGHLPAGLRSAHGGDGNGRVLGM